MVLFFTLWKQTAQIVNVHLSKLSNFTYGVEVENYKKNQIKVLRMVEEKRRRRKVKKKKKRFVVVASSFSLLFHSLSFVVVILVTVCILF